MDIIVRGEPQELDFVRRLCRDKVRRGLLAILPATSPACDEVVRLKNERDETKADMAIVASDNERLSSENIRLHERIEELEKELAGHVSNVPKNAESVPDIEKNPENGTDSVPESVPTAPDDSMVEVNLDDVKDAPAPDVKSEPEADIKDAPEPTTKKKTRTKKSE